MVKYSNGGCSGFEPDFLYFYSAYNFSNRIVFIFFCLAQYSKSCQKSQCFMLQNDGAGAKMA